jgi:hypothetical protein
VLLPTKSYENLEPGLLCGSPNGGLQKSESTNERRLRLYMENNRQCDVQKSGAYGHQATASGGSGDNFINVEENFDRDELRLLPSYDSLDCVPLTASGEFPGIGEGRGNYLESISEKNTSSYTKYLSNEGLDSQRNFNITSSNIFEDTNKDYQE